MTLICVTDFKTGNDAEETAAAESEIIYQD